MVPTTSTREVRLWLILVLALVLTILGSIALFALLENARPYVAFIRGQFYTPAPSSSQTALDRAFSPAGLVILRLALWPAVLFVLLESGAIYSLYKLMRLEGRFAAVRRLLTASALSLLTTVVLLFPVWRVLEKLVAPIPD